MLIDTHAHLFWDSYSNDLEQVLERARAAGVKKMIVPGTDLESSQRAVKLAKTYPGEIYAGVGIHPEEVATSSGNFKSQISNLKLLIAENSGQVVAVGEVGTDLHNNAQAQMSNHPTPKATEELRVHQFKTEQKELFRMQAEMALEYDLPLIIHTRESLKDTLEVLDALQDMPRGQFHCFSHDEEGLAEVLKRGFWVSFAGNITWSKRVMRLAARVPDDKLLLETDSPLMMPRDQKGEPLMDNLRNEPSNVTILARLQAEIRGQPWEKLVEQTTKNAEQLFGL